MPQADARVLSWLAHHWVLYDESLLFLSALQLATVAAWNVTNKGIFPFIHIPPHSLLPTLNN